MRARAPNNTQTNDNNDHDIQSGEDNYSISGSEESFNSEIYNIIKRHKA